MKTSFPLFLALLVLVSCQKEENRIPADEPSLRKQLTINLQDDNSLHQIEEGVGRFTKQLLTPAKMSHHGLHWESRMDAMVESKQPVSSENF